MKKYSEQEISSMRAASKFYLQKALETNDFEAARMFNELARKLGFRESLVSNGSMGLALVGEWDSQNTNLKGFARGGA